MPPQLKWGNGRYLTTDDARDATLEQIKSCVGPGWGNLLEKLVNDLISLGWNGIVFQVKEKFGGLRFYIDVGSTEIFDRIDQAENESFKTCEECGQPGKPRSGSWIVTRCDNHVAPKTTVDTTPEV